MQGIHFTRLILAGLFCSSSFVDGVEIEDVVKLVVQLSDSIQKNVDELKTELQLIKSTIASLSTRSDNITQELKRTLGSLDVNHVELQKNITSNLAQQIESLTVATKHTLEISQCGNKTVVTTRRISELPHDKEWIVIQKRGTPLKPGKSRQDFNKSWIECAEGFGDYDADFWIGLDKMHQLTSAGYTQLRVDLEDWEGNTAYGQYSVFRISSAADKYRISFDGYNGNAGDSLAKNNQLQFYTADKDIGTCALSYGPWWYNSTCGSQATLNNNYQNQSKISQWKGIHWYGWKLPHYSLIKTSMKIRLPTNETLIADECSRN